MLTQIKNILSNTLNRVIADHRSQSEAKYDNRNVSHYLGAKAQLTADEKQQIKDKWGEIIHCIPRGYHYYSGLKMLNGFSPDYLPSSFFFPFIEGVLNPERWKHQLSHKSMIQLIHGFGIKHPHTVVRTYGGLFLNENFKPMSLTETIEVIKVCDLPLLYKPSIDSEQGSGIKLILPSQIDSFCNEIISGKIFMSCPDFVLQIPVEQSMETSIFNPSSLNCMRITTININNKVSVCSRAIKCGPKGSVVDNIGSGKRGVIVGINPDGSLCGKGFYGNGEVAEAHNEIRFIDQKIKHFNRVVDAAICLHSKIDKCKIIGWDLALDSHNDPVLIEGNVIYPGISMEQMCSGPIFGDRTDEVIAYIKDCQRIIDVRK